MEIKLDTAELDGEPEPRAPGSEGCGECVKYKDLCYYYRVGKYIPKTKAVQVCYEGSYFGRQSGDKSYLIIVWDGDNFTVLESVCEGIREAMKKYKDLSPEEAIAIAVEKEEKRQERIEYWKKNPLRLE